MDVIKICGSLENVVGATTRAIILEEKQRINDYRMNISMEISGTAYYIFLSPRYGITYRGEKIDALKSAISDYEFLLDKTNDERKEFVLSILKEDIFKKF